MVVSEFLLLALNGSRLALMVGSLHKKFVSCIMPRSIRLLSLNHTMGKVPEPIQRLLNLKLVRICGQWFLDFGRLIGLSYRHALVVPTAATLRRVRDSLLLLVVSTGKVIWSDRRFNLGFCEWIDEGFRLDDLFELDPVVLGRARVITTMLDNVLVVASVGPPGVFNGRSQNGVLERWSFDDWGLVFLLAHVFEDDEVGRFVFVGGVLNVGAVARLDARSPTTHVVMLPVILFWALCGLAHALEDLVIDILLMKLLKISFVIDLLIPFFIAQFGLLSLLTLPDLRHHLLTCRPILNLGNLLNMWVDLLLGYESLLFNLWLLLIWNIWECWVLALLLNVDVVKMVQLFELFDFHRRHHFIRYNIWLIVQLRKTALIYEFRKLLQFLLIDCTSWL